jgi:Protein of unknown function (DUF3717)
MQQYGMHSDSSEILTQISLSDLEVAINRARAAMPTQGVNHELAADVAALANLYGKMIYYKQVVVPIQLLSDSEQIVLLNWVMNS